MKNRSERYWKFSPSLVEGEKIPRKAKKFILGRKLSKTKIRQRLEQLKNAILKSGVGEYEGLMYCK